MNFVTLDLETTGVNVQEDTPIQFAWTVHNDEFIRIDHEKFLVRGGKRVSDYIVKLTGITNEDIEQYGVSPSVAAASYNGLIWQRQPVALLGYNLINFDLPMLQNFLFRHVTGKFKFPPISVIYDVMFLCRDHFGGRKWPKLADSAKKLGIGFSESDLHDALADVKLTWEVFRRLVEKGAVR